MQVLFYLFINSYFNTYALVFSPPTVQLKTFQQFLKTVNNLCDISHKYVLKSSLYGLYELT